MPAGFSSMAHARGPIAPRFWETATCKPVATNSDSRYPRATSTGRFPAASRRHTSLPLRRSFPDRFGFEVTLRQCITAGIAAAIERAPENHGDRRNLSQGADLAPRGQIRLSPGFFRVLLRFYVAGRAPVGIHARRPVQILP